MYNWDTIHFSQYYGNSIPYTKNKYKKTEIVRKEKAKLF